MAIAIGSSKIPISRIQMTELLFPVGYLCVYILERSFLIQ